MSRSKSKCYRANTSAEAQVLNITGNPERIPSFLVHERDIVDWVLSTWSFVQRQQQSQVLANTSRCLPHSETNSLLVWMLDPCIIQALVTATFKTRTIYFSIRTIAPPDAPLDLDRSSARCPPVSKDCEGANGRSVPANSERKLYFCCNPAFLTYEINLELYRKNLNQVHYPWPQWENRLRALFSAGPAWDIDWWTAWICSWKLIWQKQNTTVPRKHNLIL